MEAFWNNSWESIDPNRLTQYIESFDLTADNIIEWLLQHHVNTVCDAGCGCGIYSLKLASHGFTVNGFDISSHAVRIAEQLLKSAFLLANLKTASILSTGYPDNHFDAIISRDVIDHISKQAATAAIRELYRITKPGGIIAITLDHLDDEYKAEPHFVNFDGDFEFTSGKWNGMIFHPYNEQEILQIIPDSADCQIENSESEILVKLIKPRPSAVS